MSCFNSSGSSNHAVSHIGHDHYRLEWTVDRYTKNSRLRFPTRFNRDTDEAGAVKFAKKWDCRKLPDSIRTAAKEPIE
jgi:hypothetical protein